MVLPITIAPETGTDDDENEAASTQDGADSQSAPSEETEAMSVDDNREESVSSQEQDGEVRETEKESENGEEEMEEEENEGDGVSEEDGEGTLMIDESDRNEREKETGDETKKTEIETEEKAQEAEDVESTEERTESGAARDGHVTSAAPEDVVTSGHVASQGTSDASTVHAEKTNMAETETLTAENRNQEKKPEEHKEEKQVSDEGDEFSEEEGEDSEQVEVIPRGVMTNPDAQGTDVAMATELEQDRNRRDSNDNERAPSSEKNDYDALVNGGLSDERPGGEPPGLGGSTQEEENSADSSESGIQTRKKPIDSKTAETRKFLELQTDNDVGNRKSPSRPGLFRSRSKPEGGKVQKGDTSGGRSPGAAERDSRIAPVERPNTRRQSRRVTRDDEEYIT